MDIVEFPSFSPHSRHLAYLAWRGGKMYVVVDGAEGRPFDESPFGVKSFDDARHLHTIVVRGGEFLLQEIEIGEGPVDTTTGPTR